MSAAAQRRIAASLLGVVAFVTVLATQGAQGITRDETVYMHHGSRYASWWVGLFSGESAIDARSITEHFGGEASTANNREHPPLMKTLFGLSERLFHQQLGWLPRTSAYRLPSGALLALLIVFVVLFVSRVWGLTEGIVAGLLTLLLPRALFHAGLACLDAPITALWFATIYAYYRALSSRRWCIVLGVFFGLALATKHNALLLPIAIFAHYAGVARQRADAKGLKGFLRSLWRTQPLIGLALLVLGPATLIGLWPWLWFDTVNHVTDWILFHRNHVHYNFEYLAENYTLPPFPWHVPLVTTALTTPLSTLAAFFVGLAILLRHSSNKAPAPDNPVSEVADAQTPDGQASDVHAPGLLLFAAAVAAMAPFVLRTTPIFGAEKHWAPAMPFFCIVAALGVVRAARRAMDSLLGSEGRQRLRSAGVALVSSAVISGALVETLSAQPYALTHYNALAGGAPGGADLGMNRQFWGYAARGVLPWLQGRAPAEDQPPKRVFPHDASPAWHIYQEDGLLSKRLPNAGRGSRGIRRSDLALVIHEQHFAFHDILIWKTYGTLKPAYVLTTGGVPIVSVYARPKALSGK